MRGLTRRRAIGLGAVAGAGVVLSGATTATAAVPTARPASAASSGTAGTAATAPGRTLVLHGVGLRLLGPRRPLTTADTLTIRGGVADTAGGLATGEVFVTGTVLAAPSRVAPDLASVQSHLFVLPDGTLTGHGTVDHAGRGRFTVTGGTGRYLGTRGSYSTVQSADHRGGGDAVFTFDLAGSPA